MLGGIYQPILVCQMDALSMANVMACMLIWQRNQYWTKNIYWQFIFSYYVFSIFGTLKVDRFGVGKNNHYLHLFQLFDSKCIVLKKRSL
jgi:hypothetical protein